MLSAIGIRAEEFVKAVALVLIVGMLVYSISASSEASKKAARGYANSAALKATAKAQRDVSTAIVMTQRHGCNIGATIYVHYVDGIRAQIVGDLAVGHDPGQPPKTRAARLRQAKVEMRNLLFFQKIIDSSHAPDFLDARDRKAVAANGVSCNKIYPLP